MRSLKTTIEEESSKKKNHHHTPKKVQDVFEITKIGVGLQEEVDLSELLQILM